MANQGARQSLLTDGWKDVGRVFIFAAILDVIYQLVEQPRVYPLEVLIVSTLLGLVPYVLVRGPTTRIVRRLTTVSDQQRNQQ
jgi:hypothetical protein